jgi:hypothetical protein
VTSLPTQSARIGDLPVERVMNAQFFRTPAGQLVLLRCYAVEVRL